jgi:hypothetical protein
VLTSRVFTVPTDKGKETPLNTIHPIGRKENIGISIAAKE